MIQERVFIEKSIQENKIQMIKFELNKLFGFCLAYSFIFYYYLGSFRVIILCCYILLLLFALYYILKESLSLSLFNLCIILTFVALFLISFVKYDSIILYLLSFRLNFGFLVILAGFMCIPSPNLEKIFIFLAFITILDKLLIMLYPNAIYILANYDSGITFNTRQASSLFGGMHSFGGNRSVSAIILLSGFFYLKNKKDSAYHKRILLLFSSFWCMSGSAFWLFNAWLLYRLLNYFKGFGSVRFFITILGVLFGIFLYLKSIEILGDFDDRFSLIYVQYIFEYKLGQIEYHFSQFSLIDYIVGLGDLGFSEGKDASSGIGGVAGDFMLLDFFVRFGIAGLMLYVFVL